MQRIKERLSIFVLFLGCMLGITMQASAADLPHQGDFLTNGLLCRARWASLSSSERQECISRLKQRGYTHLYVNTVNCGEDRPSVYNFYKDPATFKSRLQELRDNGIEPVVWMTSDQNKCFTERSLSAIKADFDRLVPVIDSVVSSYLLGLELNEYWTRAEADELGNHLQGLTSKKVAAHQTGGRWDYCKSSWCDYMILQYGFVLSESAIKDMTRRAIADLKKPVVAGEYNLSGPESLSVRLGDAAIAAGASGFGNGGTPR
jgi:hypothetical protein